MNAYARRPLTQTISVKCKADDGRTYSMLLLKLSRNGCSLEPVGQIPSSSQNAQIQLPGLSFLPGRITRTSACEVKIEFDAQLYEPVFEHLKTKLRG